MSMTWHCALKDAGIPCYMGCHPERPTSVAKLDILDAAARSALLATRLPLRKSGVRQDDAQCRTAPTLDHEIPAQIHGDPGRQLGCHAVCRAHGSDVTAPPPTFPTPSSGPLTWAHRRAWPPGNPQPP